LARLADKDSDPDVRLTAAAAMHQVDLRGAAARAAAGATPKVQELIGKLGETDAHESTAAANALARLGPQAKEAAGSLALALESPNKWLRVAAAEALASIGRDALPVLAAVKKLTEDPDDDVRAAAEKAAEKIESAPAAKSRIMEGPAGG